MNEAGVVAGQKYSRADDFFRARDPAGGSGRRKAVPINKSLSHKSVMSLCPHIPRGKTVDADAVGSPLGRQGLSQQ